MSKFMVKKEVFGWLCNFVALPCNELSAKNSLPKWSRSNLSKCPVNFVDFVPCFWSCRWLRLRFRCNWSESSPGSGLHEPIQSGPKPAGNRGHWNVYEYKVVHVFVWGLYVVNLHFYREIENSAYMIWRMIVFHWNLNLENLEPTKNC